MKKLFSLCLICLLAMSAMAQRAAVMEFKAGVGISQADVDGLSGIFTTYFRPSGYTMIERTQIDRIIDEQQMQRSTMTESQMVRIGELLNLSKIVIGDVNIVMGQYNVDVRVINVESGTIAATEGATFAGSSYREGMKNLAQKLAAQIAIGAGPTVGAQPTPPSPTPKTRTKVETVYGYLHVFPNELGVFQSHPNSVIANINNQGMHGYDEWRVPTNEELSLLRANGYLSGAQYMTKENASGMVLLVTTGKSVAEKEAIRAEQVRQAEIARQKEAERQAELAEQAEAARYAELLNQGYVDLGLPSGILWKNKRESDYYTYDNAVREFGNSLPSKQQFQELVNHCTWQNVGTGYRIVGKNGNSIMIHTNGYLDCDGRGPFGVGQSGPYWTSTSYDSDEAYEFLISIHDSIREFYNNDRCNANSVQLVAEPSKKNYNNEGSIVYLSTSEFKKKVCYYNLTSGQQPKWKYIGDKPCLIDFSTTWCGWCKKLRPILEQVAKQYAGKVYVYTLDAEKEPEVAALFGVRSYPTVVFCPMEGSPNIATGYQELSYWQDAVKQILKIE